MTTLTYYERAEFGYFNCSELGVLMRIAIVNKKPNAFHSLGMDTIVSKNKYSKDEIQDIINEEFNPEIVKLEYNA